MTIETTVSEATRSQLVAAENYFKRYQALLQKALVSQSALEIARTQLYTALRVLSNEMASIAEQPQQAFHAFAVIVYYLLQPNGEAQAKKYSVQWYVDDTLRAGVQQALCMFPRISLGQALMPYFEAHPTTRKDLLQLCLVTGEALPENYLMQSLSQKKDNALCAQALYCAAWQQRYGINTFRQHYSALLEQTTEKASCKTSLANALLGGLLRADANVKKLLPMVLQSAETEPHKQRILRLMAVSGEASFVPTLQAHGNYLLLALHGHKEVIPLLLAALQQPEHAAAAKIAWQLLTDQYVVTMSGIRKNILLDVAACERWWQQQDWQAEQRYLLGKPVNSAVISEFRQRYGGWLSEDVTIIESLQQRRPLYHSGDVVVYGEQH